MVSLNTDIRFTAEAIEMGNYTIRLIGPLTQITGKSHIDIAAAEGITVDDLLMEVGRRHGERVKTKILTPEGNLHPYVLVSVNGTNIMELNGTGTRLHDGDSILVAVNIVGG
jgi:molybdopterin converting factor small subunit